MTVPTSETDIVVVGLGAAGGIAAHVLCSAGLSVVGLEAGPWRTDTDFPPDELSNWQFRNTLGAKYNRERPTWRETADGPTVPAPASLGMMMNGVGGSTVHYGAWSRRFLPDDFRARTSTLERYGEAAIPRDATLADWPVSYDDLEPYYDRVEKLLGVSGLGHDVRGRAQHPEANVFEGWRSDAYPLPPLRDFAGGQLFTEACRRLGHHPHRVPAAVISADYDGRQGCTYCGWCSGYGCRFGSKSSTLVSAIPKALETGRLDVRPFARVTRLLVDGVRVTGVEYVDGMGRAHHVRAARVVLAAYTYENIRLLLLTRTGRFPDGIGNQRGQLGQHFLTHNYLEVAGTFPDTPMNRFTGPTPQAVAIDDFNADNFDHTGLDFIRGGTIGLENQLQPIGAANAVPLHRPQWGRAYKEYLLRNWNHIHFIRAQPEPLSYVGNVLDLDPAATEPGPLAFPKVRVTYAVRENERRMSAFLLERMEEIIREMGAEEVWRGPTFTGILSSHDIGGARMGDDPGTSVTDSFGQVHDVEGLVVAGGATFPTCTGTNPTETIQATAWRTAEELARQLGSGQPGATIVATGAGNSSGYDSSTGPPARPAAVSAGSASPPVSTM